MKRARSALAAVVSFTFLLVEPQSSSAQALPRLEEIMTPHERELFADAVQQQLTTLDTDPKSALGILDQVLAKDPEPTQFRGFVQMMRATALITLNRSTDAMSAVDESVRLLPGFSGPLMVAEDVYAYSDRPAEAADFLLRAIEIDPELARSLDDYDVHNLQMRLLAARQQKRFATVASKLLAIGWNGRTLSGRSDLAFGAIKLRMSEGDGTRARALIPEIIDPVQTYSLLADNRYREIWPDLERWGGPRLERQWKLFLTEARARFLASKSPEDAVAYARVMDQAQEYDALIADVLPVLSRKLDRVADAELVFAIPRVAHALAVEGRWKEMHALFEHGLQVWPIGSDANALNLSSNYAKLMTSEGNYADAVRLMDISIRDTKQWGRIVTADALASMHIYRACALHKLGRESEAAVSIAAAVASVDSGRLVTLQLCLGNKLGARTVLLKALNDEETRLTAIDLLQKRDGPSCKSDHCTEMDKLTDELQSDPTLVQALQKYGRVLPFAVSEAASIDLSQPKPSSN